MDAAPREPQMVVALTLALVAHIALLAAHFNFHPPQPATTSLEITLAAFKSEKAPEQADFLAQQNQEGSGTEAEALAPATQEIAPFATNKITPVQPTEQPASAPPSTKARILTTQAASTEHTPTQAQPTPLQPEPTPDFQPSLLRRSLEIASLEAQLREQQQTHAKRPIKRQLTAASTREVRDAYYLDGWRRKVERIGNLNYPAQARKQQIYGQLRMMVSINKDGTLNDVRILQSSGQPILDEAALDIVRLAAPFQAFPPEIAKDTDILEIIRTWQFEKGNYVSSF
ncbi:TonB-like protein [gamma proteobacterium HdN1]|nr:TonB-like protein [gamma proteobacterium HdN1]